MSIRDNYLFILKKLGKPNSKGYFLMKKGAKRSDIDSILKNSDVQISTVLRVATALEVTTDALIKGEEKPPKEKRKAQKDRRKDGINRRTGKSDRRMNINTLYSAIAKIRTNSSEVAKEVSHCSKLFGEEIVELCTINILSKMIKPQVEGKDMG